MLPVAHLLYDIWVSMPICLIHLTKNLYLHGMQSPGYSKIMDNQEHKRCLQIFTIEGFPGSGHPNRRLMCKVTPTSVIVLGGVNGTRWLLSPVWSITGP